MVDDEKDRLGNKLRDAERAREDQYFAERDRQLVEAQRAKKGAEQAAKQVGSMRCPKDGSVLAEHSHNGVTVEECPSCHGMWLDYGELQAMAGQEKEGWIARWLRLEFSKTE